MIDLEKVNASWGEEILKIHSGELVLIQDTMPLQNNRKVINNL